MGKKQLSLPSLKKKVQRVFNKYIRMRDSYNGFFNCIACGKTKPVSQMHAGHYFPAGQYQSLRFNEHNVNGECVACNYFSGDHLIGYQKNLIAKIGEDAFRHIERTALWEKNRGCHKIDRITLDILYSDYSKKINGKI